MASGGETNGAVLSEKEPSPRTDSIIVCLLLRGARLVNSCLLWQMWSYLPDKKPLQHGELARGPSASTFKCRTWHHKVLLKTRAQLQSPQRRHFDICSDRVYRCHCKLRAPATPPASSLVQVVVHSAEESDRPNAASGHPSCKKSVSGLSLQPNVHLDSPSETFNPVRQCRELSIPRST